MKSQRTATAKKGPLHWDLTQKTTGSLSLKLSGSGTKIERDGRGQYTHRMVLSLTFSAGMCASPLWLRGEWWEKNGGDRTDCAVTQSPSSCAPLDLTSGGGITDSTGMSTDWENNSDNEISLFSDRPRLCRSTGDLFLVLMYSNRLYF